MTIDLDTQHPYIGTSQRTAHSTNTRNLINPATGELTTAIIDCDVEDVDAAVHAATSAQRTWINMNPAARVDVLLRWADLVHVHRAELGALDTTNMGRVLNLDPPIGPLGRGS
jgi:acyl-CoA reductase-like NAD-dependent aldehyde dehydrogenase